MVVGKLFVVIEPNQIMQMKNYLYWDSSDKIQGQCVIREDFGSSFMINFIGSWRINRLICTLFSYISRRFLVLAVFYHHHNNLQRWHHAVIDYVIFSAAASSIVVLGSKLS